MNENFTPEVNTTPVEEPKNENFAMGLLGAFLFSLSGGIIWFVLYMMGYIAAISGIIGVIAAIKGYEIFAKGQSVKGVITSTVIAFLVIVIAWYLSIAYTVSTELNVSYFDAIAESYVLFSIDEVAIGLWKDLGLGLLFCVIGCITPIRNALAKANR